MMNTTLKRMGTMFLLVGALLSASAAFAQSRFPGDMYAFNGQNDRHRSNQDRRGSEDRRQPDRSNDNAGRNAERNEPRRDGGRMSADERRALRQQIDEAGRDIYRPRR